jgi:hypothetical protein
MDGISSRDAVCSGEDEFLIKIRIIVAL